MTLSDADIRYAQELLEKARSKGIMIATAESCTGGLIAGLITEVAGCSDVFDRGFVTYSNQAKVDQLGVPKRLIDQHGAVSQLVSLAMAEGALVNSKAQLSVSVTGIAGPTGGSDEKPVGLVHFGCALEGYPTIHDKEVFQGDRAEIRSEAARHALRMLMSRL